MKLKALLALILAVVAATGFVYASEDVAHPAPQSWTWDGPFGTFDRQQLQRGYQVYKEVCAACHSMRLVSFRNLAQPGGPEFSEAQMKAIAASFQVPTLDEKGETVQRPGIPADRFPSPFPNEKAARAANNNALPPDLSVVVKARAGGPDYIYALITGYSDPPAGFTLLSGLYYNPYFSGHQIAMAPPLASDGLVTWPEGNPQATKAQMARDVVAFLMWAAEPKLEERKRLGVQVVIFLILLSVLLYFAYKRLWRDVDH
jgi:cytochrome c1